MTPRPFRFLAGPGEATGGAAVAADARRAEAMGYSALVYPDHVVNPLGMVPVLAWAAAATDRLRVAPFVANNDLRHPALLAQDLATLDVLSGGRVEAAIGAGWNVFIGSADGLAAKFGELRERLGISSFMVGDLDTLAPVVERLAGT